MDQLIDAKVVRDDGNTILENSKSLEKMISDLDGIISALKANWQDNAYTEFVRLYEQKKPTLEAFVKDLNSYGNRAIEHADTMEAGQEVL